MEKKYREMETANSSYELRMEKEHSKYVMEMESMKDKLKIAEDNLEWQRNKEQISRSKNDLKKSESNHFFGSSGDIGTGFSNKYSWK